MSFTVQDFNDLTRLRVEHPEWRSELRRLLLSDELLTLPQAVRELVEAQQRAEERLQRLETVVESLAEAQRRAEERLQGVEERLQGVEERLQRLEMIVESLVEAQQRAEERLSRLETTVQNLVEQVSILVESQQRTQDTVGGLKGRLLELTYHQKAGTYFGLLLRRVRVVEPHTLEDTLEARLTPGEFRDVLRLDLLLSGLPRQRFEAPEVWLAVEISAIEIGRTSADMRYQHGIFILEGVIE